MRVCVQKWGDNLALRFPKHFAAKAGIHEGTLMDITVEAGKLVLQVVYSDVPSLEELVSRITKRNRHAEVHVGPPVGNELW
jgi:antitoxin MazE